MKGAICCNWAPFVHFLATDSMRQLFVQSCGTGAVPFLALNERNQFIRDSSEKKLKKVVAKLFRVVVI